MSNRLLVTGANGQLGTAFVSLLANRGCQYTAVGHSAMDIANAVEVRRVITEYQPDVVINAAAFTDVERAETDWNAAIATNQLGVANLRDACRNHGCLLIHFSSDYVFDGETRQPYIESDAPRPINAYGKSKLLGDLELLNSDFDDYLIFRSSWVFGAGQQNFFTKLLHWSKSNDVLEVVYDQLSTPTYTIDIAEIALSCMELKLRGLFNLSNAGYASRYEVAREMFKQMRIDKLVLPVPSAKFGSAVNRPFFSQLSIEKLERSTKISVPCWQDALKRYLNSEGLIK